MKPGHRVVSASVWRVKKDRLSSRQRKLLLTALASVIVLTLMLASCSPLVASPMAVSKGAPLDTFAASQGCTSFCLDNGGYCIFGTNHDNSIPEGIVYVNKRNLSKTGWEGSTTGQVARWTSKYGSLTFNLVGYQLPWAGMNETGLVVSTMALEESLVPAPDERPPLESPLWVQYQLDTSSTIEEVIASEPLVRFTSQLQGCCHYMVCDRTAACATIEFLEGEMVVHAGSTLRVAALTNSIYEESVQAWHEGSLDEPAEMEESVSSLFRFAVAADAVTSFKPTDSGAAVESAFETLAQASNRWTAWSIVFDPENFQVHFRTKGNSQIRSIDFSKLDFACDTRVQMLDVHKNLLGDVSDDLYTYSHKASLDHFVNVLEKLGLGTSRDQLDSLLQQMESYSCTNNKEHISQDASHISLWIWMIGAAVLVIIPLTVWYKAQKRAEHS